MASIWEKAISILAGNLNSGRTYLITAVPRRAEEDQNRDSLSRARQESKDHSIHYSTILCVLLFNKSGENSNVNKRKTQKSNSKGFDQILRKLEKFDKISKIFVAFSEYMKIYVSR